MNGVALEYKDGMWTFDPEALRKQLKNPKVKVFLFNNPQNPTGKVFSVEEMKTISSILDECPHVLTFSDEVYEMVTFDGREHTVFATIGNNWDRTISVFSGGKLLNASGWKIGWAIGPQKLIYIAGIISNTMFYAINTPGQVAFANAIHKVYNEGYNDKG